MNQLKVVSLNGKLVTDSREVAKMIGRPHNELMKSIRTYIEYLGEGNFPHADFFIESEYLDVQNKKRPCFQITKKGCEMVANKLTGEKGVLFTAAYVTKFNEMEQQPRVLTDKEQLKASMRLSLEASETLEQHDERITNLEETMRIDGAQEHTLNKKGRQVVVESLGGKSSPAYKNMAFKVFSAFWRDFKNHFEIPRYGDLPKKKYEEGLRFIGMWQPSTSLKIEIDNANRQQTIQEVI
ncbi:ORF6C domain-containing protein [Oceanobacillus alkalisoli]|uniref:ORF6C domain-containing protein n=1 Tax=Oceanobacillus alkalisoli TaxID=2925113 RepID=UPI001EF149F4|nr:ORF6C domain-containing protein [Oceanobacillus alkalisoli]MCF3942167.1 ORF6C domain-containing protein [Oceanobacillus alkalisoli]MCG5104399.1 ORF6C domain-containing protein [Oceanobacillus alkalisoli]